MGKIGATSKAAEKVKTNKSNGLFFFPQNNVKHFRIKKKNLTCSMLVIKHDICIWMSYDLTQACF